MSRNSGYSYNERAMMSLASVDAALAEPSTELVVRWGEDGGGSVPWIELYEQVEIRVTVAPGADQRRGEGLPREDRQADRLDRCTGSGTPRDSGETTARGFLRPAA